MYVKLYPMRNENQLFSVSTSHNYESGRIPRGVFLHALWGMAERAFVPSSHGGSPLRRSLSSAFKSTANKKRPGTKGTSRHETIWLRVKDPVTPPASFGGGTHYYC